MVNLENEAVLVPFEFEYTEDHEECLHRGSSSIPNQGVEYNLDSSFLLSFPLHTINDEMAHWLSFMAFFSS